MHSVGLTIHHSSPQFESSAKLFWCGINRASWNCPTLSAFGNGSEEVDHVITVHRASQDSDNRLRLGLPQHAEPRRRQGQPVLLKFLDARHHPSNGLAVNAPPVLAERAGL